MWDRHTVEICKVNIKQRIRHARINAPMGSMSDNMIWLKIDINPKLLILFLWSVVQRFWTLFFDSSRCSVFILDTVFQPLCLLVHVLQQTGSISFQCILATGIKNKPYQTNTYSKKSYCFVLGPSLLLLKRSQKGWTTLLWTKKDSCCSGKSWYVYFFFKHWCNDLNWKHTGCIHINLYSISTTVACFIINMNIISMNTFFFL